MQCAGLPIARRALRSAVLVHVTSRASAAVLAGALVLLQSAPALARAQGTAPRPAGRDAAVHLTTRGLSFDETIAALGQQSGCCILVDGEPALVARSIDVSGSLSGALDAVCDAFDYTWSTSRTGVVLLRKRFRDPHTLPQFDNREMVSVAHRIADALGQLPYDRDPGRMPAILTELYLSMSPEESQGFWKSAWLHASSLSGPQRELVYDAVWNNAFARFRSEWEGLAEALDATKRSSIVIGRPENGTAAIGAPGGPPELVIYRYRDAGGHEISKDLYRTMGREFRSSG